MAQAVMVKRRTRLRPATAPGEDRNSGMLTPIFASRVRPQHTAVDEHLDQPAQPCVATTPGLPSCMVRPVRLGAVSLTTASRSQEAQQLAYHDPLHGNAHRVNVTRTTSFDDHSGVVIDFVGGPCVAGGGTCDSGPIRCAKIGVRCGPLRPERVAMLATATRARIGSTATVLAANSAGEIASIPVGSSGCGKCFMLSVTIAPAPATTA